MASLLFDDDVALPEEESPAAYDPQTHGLFSPEDIALANQLTAPDAPIDEVGVMEQLGASFRRETIPGAIIDRLQRPSMADAPGEEQSIDVFEHLTPEEKLRAADFADVNSLGDLRRARDQEERERQLLDTIGRGPLPRVASDLSAILTDPTSWAGAGAAVKMGTKLGTITASVAKGGAIVGGAEAVREGVLQSTQRTRSGTETAASIFVGVIAGGALGALGGRAAAHAAAEADTAALLRHNYGSRSYDDLARMTTELQGGGAASARPAAELTELVGHENVRRLSKGMEKAFVSSASMEVATSRIPAAREALAHLVDTGMVTRGNVVGHAGPVAIETEVRAANASIARGIQELKVQHKRALAEGFQGNRAAFERAVGEAMVRMDTGAHPRVTETAKALRKVFDHYAGKAQAAGILPKDLPSTEGISYLTRVWNIQAIKSNTTAFKDFLTEYFARTIPLNQVASPAEYRALAENVYQHIIGGPSRRTAISIPIGSRGPLKERTFHIRDDEAGLERWVDRNASRVLGRYVHTMATETAIARRFGKDGFEAALARIDDDAHRLADADPANANAILAEAAATKQTLQSLFELVRGTNKPHPFWNGKAGTQARELLRDARAFNFLRMLGGVTISSIPDLGRVILADGFARAIALPLRELATGFKGIKLAKQEAQDFGLALNWTMAGRNDMFLEIGEEYAANTTREAVRAASGGAFSKLTLMATWNDTMQSVTSALIVNRMTRALRTGNIDPRNVRKFAQGGIDQNMLNRIAAQAEHWTDEGGQTVVNLNRWTDQEAADAFRFAVNREVNTIIINPSAGDAPLWATSEIGKTATQFKKFAMAMTQRAFVATLQERDAPAIASVITMFTLGMMATALKDILGKGELKDRSAAQWALEGIDRSGITGLLFELDSIADKLPLVPSIQGTLGDEGLSRFATRDLVGTAFGPTPGLFEDIITAGINLEKGDPTIADLQRIRRLAPGQNLFYLKYLVEQLTQGAGETLGLPEDRKKKARFKAG